MVFLQSRLFLSPPVNRPVLFQGMLTVLLMVSVMVLLTGCGGGGGGGGGVSISRPPISVITPTPDPGVSIEPSAVELANTPALGEIAATSIYAMGVTGEGMTIGVVDSGVDADHSELSGRVIGGGDWQSSGDGTDDPYGHGTHVASIIAAASNNEGTQGIAPLAEIVSYRILNSSGKFGGKSGNTMVPAILGDAQNRDLKVVNNSWASIYEITDLSASTIQSAISSELSAYRKSSTAQGPVMVWAAGNGSDNNVSIRSGLPYYFPELKANWLTVVSVDLDGVEPVYTNRCGVSAEWCLTAPGGGDNQFSEGIEAARAGGGYTKKSGTSMAAPLVSGALGLVLEHMPNLSPRQAAARLIETAHYDGLKTRSGCTITTCTEAKMKAVFGQGMIDLQQALQPIGASSLVNNAGQHSDLETSYITTPILVGDAIKRGLEGRTAVAQDHFDGARFLVSLDDHIQHQEKGIDKGQPPSFQSYGFPLGASGFMASASSSVPLAHDIPARLIDIPAAATQSWQGYHFSGQDYTARAYLGYGEERQAAHLMVASHGHSSSADTARSASSPVWVGAGVDRSTYWLDGRGDGALGYDHSGSIWMFAGHQRHIGSIKATAEALIGQTRLTPQASSIIRGGHLIYDSWSLRFDMPITANHWASGWQVSIDQPPALRQGHMVIEQPIGFSNGRFQFAHQRVDLALSARQHHAGVMYYLHPNALSTMKVGVDFIDNYGHRDGQQESQAFMAFTQRF